MLSMTRFRSSVHVWKSGLGLSLRLSLISNIGFSLMAAGDCADLRALHLFYTLPEPSGGIQRLPLTITLPPETAAAPGNTHSVANAAPYPTVLLFNGFKMKASYYHQYAERLAKAGYATVQYDTPLLKLPTDAVEVSWLPGLLDWLESQTEKEASPLHRQLDMTRTATAGHSRGGKLAALHFAENSKIAAAYLIEPVDNTSQTPESPAYPSACAALRNTSRPVAITGAGIIGPCNPAGSNYKVFFESSAAGSWLMDVKGAGHGTFLRPPWVLRKLFDVLCHRGSESHQDAMELAGRPMLAWFGRHLGQAHQKVDEEDDFFEWVEAEKRLGKITFEVKHQAASKQLQGTAVPAKGCSDNDSSPTLQGKTGSSQLALAGGLC